MTHLLLILFVCLTERGNNCMSYVFVTGACINTGTAIVEKFAGEGCNVIFTGRNKESVITAEEKYRKKFPEVEIYGFVLNSLLNEYTVDEKSAAELFLRLDGMKIIVDTLVLNAAEQGLSMKIFENPLSDFMRVININVTWNYLLCELAASRMKNIGGGSIVFINSNTAYRAIPNRIAYSASKGGQLGMMRALALDLGKYNIRVNAVLPGMIKTDRWEKNPEFYKNVPSSFTPLGDVAVGADVAEAVWYFARHARNTTGAELVVDGGNSAALYPIIPKNQ